MASAHFGRGTDGPSGRRRLVSFEDEMPVPESNVFLYRRIYLLEQWERRIALASLMARYGSTWNNAIPTSIVRDITPRLQSLKNRVFFDAESSDNAIWALTLNELASLLGYRKVWPYVKELTGYRRQELLARLEDLREIRNVIGHNRAANDYTVKVFEAIEEALGQGISRFKDRFIYDLDNRQQPITTSPGASLFYEMARPATTDSFGEDPYFYYIYSLPRGESEPLSLGDLLEHFDEVRRVVLAFQINRQAVDEFTVIWPKSAADDEHRAVFERFASFERGRDVLYGEQNPKYVCHPKIWFAF